MNKVLKLIKKKAKLNNKIFPFISIDDILLIRSEHDEDDALLLGDIHKWLNERNILVKEFDHLDKYLTTEIDRLEMKAYELSPITKQIVLDEITPTCLNVMNGLAPGTEQALVYYLAAGVLTNEELSHYMTTKMLSKKMRMGSGKISTYLLRLEKKGIVDKKPLNNKNFEYTINSQIFIDWFKCRYKAHPMKK